MTFQPVSLLAIVVILATLAVAWSRRFLAAGALAIGNVVIFLLTAFGPRYADGLDTIPVIHAELSLYTPNLTGDWKLAAIQSVTSMFVHYDFMHLFGNMLVLVLFGLPFEERIGGRRFLVLYLLGGLMGSLVMVATTLGGEGILLMGASGAIFAIIGAFAVSYPNTIVPVPVSVILVTFFVRMKVWMGAILMAAMQLVLMALFSGVDNTAYFAHIGGVAGGTVLGYTLVKGKTPAHRNPVAVDLEALSPFARDSGTASALAQMKSNHDEPQIFQAWLDRFFRTASCPQCSHKVMPRHHGEIVCTQGHRFDVRRDRSKAVPA